MADRPILFSAPMIRALLAGTKTQTRRVLKPLPNRTIFFDPKTAGVNQHQSPRFSAGDRLWVRETWSGNHQFRDTPPAQRESVMTSDGPILREDIHFWAEGGPLGGDYEKPRPGIHMPRWASRMTLTVTDVRVERLQDISEEDADAECFGGNYPSEVLPEVFPGSRDQYGHLTMAQCYGRLWDHINGAGAWDANPWVVAYTFTVHHGNIDQIAQVAA